MLKNTTRVKRGLRYIVLAIFAAGLAGCQGPAKSSTPSGIIARKCNTPPAYMLSIDDLAKKLGLTATMPAGQPYYELKNANNRVVLFLYKDGRVHVNGTPVCAVGPVVDVKGTYYVSEILFSQIRANLNNGQPAWKPVPTPTPKWTPRTSSGMVVIDPGHGGKDPGAISVLGYYEKGINLSIAKRLVAILQKRGIQAILTRQGDTFIELNDRADVANNAGADLFVAIHADSNGDRSHQGFTVFIARSPNETSRRLARSIESALSSTGIESNGIKGQDYRVLVRTSCPAVLVECGFLSNSWEAGILDNADHQDRIAAAIADGIINNL